MKGIHGNARCSASLWNYLGCMAYYAGIIEDLKLGGLKNEKNNSYL